MRIYYNNGNALKLLVVNLYNLGSTEIPNEVMITNPKLYPQARYNVVVNNLYTSVFRQAVLAGNKILFTDKDNYLVGSLLYI